MRKIETAVSLRISTALMIGLLVYVWARLLWYIVASFSWPMDGDLSFLYYFSWLMNAHDYVPYKDIHETSFFGTFIFYSSLTKLIGYSGTAFHFANLFFFSVLSIITYFLLKPYGRLCSLLAIGLFGEFYFSRGVGVLLQRDFIALFPAALALLISQNSRLSNNKKSFYIGVLFAIASCIKPQFAAGAILMILLTWLPSSNLSSDAFKRFFVGVLSSLFGFGLIWGLGFGWLFYHHTTHEFFDMAFNYLPAYSSVNGRNFARENADAWTGAYNWLSGSLLMWGIPVVISLWISFRISPRKALPIFVIFLWVLYLTYVPMAGKYWDYHQTPSFYFLSILLSFIFSSNKTAPAGNKLFLFFVPIWGLFYFIAVIQGSALPKPQVNVEMNQRLEISTSELIIFLKEHTQPGDKVLSDTSHTRGPIFPALLVTGLLPPTPYVENYLLYHNINSAFTQHARKYYMEILQNSPPEYIISTPPSFFFSGQKTEFQFKNFTDWRDKNYTLIQQSSDLPMQSITETFSIYKRN